MQRRTTVLVATTIGLTSLGAVPQSASAAPPDLTCRRPVGGQVTCTSYQPGETRFTVPAGVRALHVRLVGAVGGRGAFGYGTEDADGNPTETWSSAAGGLGAELQGDLNVGAGEQLYLVVGGHGRDGGFDPGATLTGLGGANGGGAGGGLGNSRFRGGGGGGASDLRVSGDGLTNRVMVAGGGGGAGSGGTWPAKGGNNDQDALADGRPAPCAGGSGHSKRAGTGFVAGLPGEFGQGGAGSPSDDSDYFAGGGGGGGYGGGGGGAEAIDADTTYTGEAGCGGGGGSSFFNHRRYAVRGTTSTLWSTSAPAGVTVTYRLPTS